MPVRKKRKVKKTTFFYPSEPIKVERKNKVKNFGKITSRIKKVFSHIFNNKIFKTWEEIRNKPTQSFLIFLTAFVISSVLTSLVFASIFNAHIAFSMPKFNGLLSQKTAFSLNVKNEFIDPYEVVLSLKKHRNDFILVDVRSKDEYEAGHISGSVNIPGYKNSEDLTRSSEQEKNIKKMFAKLFSSRKNIVLYAQTSYSMTPSQIAKLVGHSGQVSIMSIGYNEWAHMKTFWVPESEWARINPDDFVQH